MKKHFETIYRNIDIESACSKPIDIEWKIAMDQYQCECKEEITIVLSKDHDRVNDCNQMLSSSDRSRSDWRSVFAGTKKDIQNERSHLLTF